MLVILGLLIGGILTGSSLIRAAELRSVTSSVTQLQTAIYTFREKYSSLPGDMNNATRFWGEIHATDATCIGLDSPDGVLTCNGNGNGEIDQYLTEYSERFHAWVHLSNAGLFEGSYTGHHAGTMPGDVVSIPGINVPGTKISNSVILISHSAPYATAGAEHYPGSYGNLIIVQGQGGNGIPAQRIFTPEELWNIDTKIDDGKPAYGRILANRAGGTWQANCATNATASLAEYNLSSTNNDCWLMARSGY